ncbi:MULTISPECIES: tripartite tricarboxylate transporter substrate-binding protein [unclassified Beijerinckia]|uniref:Bug family tripartite tricarboxylate transporter substrate binding protein n=1 Tax=unclassified Beijerinckia TaxID=2638183 RepID=UPI00089CFDB1|nr:MULTISPECIES: tripartite tricarboxylate transporter substrate-binding protein [unclassified Beijerinckia]MDH7793976.1 tripartite-type tricarboxylate transporter receptor subunit TctC [Beijerinckia sp. GAS462]SEB50633.1 Tripartite-type tricarboxylate transporter, receptor component TctC [Beijerinckia sp. 28-YEA-48]
MANRLDFTRRSTLKVLGTAAASSVLPGVSFAQTKWPNDPIKFVVPFGAGGVGDITARIAAEKIGDKLGQRLYIENQPAAGGITAGRAVAAANPDGNTVTLFSNGTAISVGLFKQLPFDPVKQFRPVSTISFFDFIFVTAADQPYKTLGDVLTAARAKPGQLNIGTIAVGSTQHLSAELFKSQADVDIRVVNFRTTPDLMLAVMRKDVDLIVDSYASLKTNIEDGSLRALATSSGTRSQWLPNLPTAQEAGVPNFDVLSWNAIYVPAGVSDEIVNKLNGIMREVMADEDTKKRMLQIGVESRGGTPEETLKRLTDDITRWTAVIDKANIEKR